MDKNKSDIDTVIDTEFYRNRNNAVRSVNRNIVLYNDLDMIDNTHAHYWSFLCDEILGPFMPPPEPIRSYRVCFNPNIKKRLSSARGRKPGWNKRLSRNRCRWECSRCVG